MKPFSTGKFSIFYSRSLITNPMIPISEIQLQTLFKTSNFSTSPNQFGSSPSSLYQSRRHDDESRNVRVLVWWDFENCGLPAGTNVFRVSQSITAAIRVSGIKGPVQITAFGDVLQLSRSNQEALSSTGINLTHIPQGGKNSADRSLLVDLMYWVSQNPPPAHLFLISGDRDFANILHRLRMNNYNILLASPHTAPGVLCSAASIMWHWSSLVKGEKNLTAKYFNQPPDGPYSSWYGHYKVNLEDPFAISEDFSDPDSDPVFDPVSNPMGRIPKKVMKQICQILIFYPEGISITDLREELGKSKLSIDRNFYGYKKFSRFLLSMPEILDIESRPDGQYFVRGKVSEPRESKCMDLVDSLKKNNDDDDNYHDEMHVKEPPTKMPECSEQVEGPMELPDLPSVVEKVEKIEEIENCTSPVKESDEVGYFNRIWKKWFSNLTEEVKESEKKCDGTKSEEVIVDENNGEKCEGNDGKSSGDTGFLRNVITWCRSWRSGLHADNPSEDNSENTEKMNAACDKNKIFLKESFWKDMRAFLNSPYGVDSVLQSRNRKQMARNLQKQGPSILESLGQTDLLRLIDLLISDKKWVAESPSHTFPFKLIDSNMEKNSSTYPHPSIFSAKSSPSTCQGEPSLPPVKSRDEILSDCQELVDEIVKKYPKGFNVGLFRKLFLQKYRYSLDIKNLGYKKMLTLLQIIPGAKIESGVLFPSNANPSIEEDNSRGRKVNLDSDNKTLSAGDKASGSEDGSVSSTGFEGQVKARVIKGDNGPLLKILDTWYNEDSSSSSIRVETGNMNGQVGCLGNGLRPSSSRPRTDTGTPAVNNGQKQKRSKRYSFVADQIGGKDSKNKFVDRILL